MKKQFYTFSVRWVLNSFGLWVAVRIFDADSLYSGAMSDAYVFLIAGLIFSVINTVLRPIVIILSLPAILLTLGLFTIIVNGLMVYVSLMISPGISMSFWHSVLTGVILSLVNYIVSGMLEISYGVGAKGRV